MKPTATTEGIPRYFDDRNRQKWRHRHRLRRMTSRSRRKTSSREWRNRELRAPSLNPSRVNRTRLVIKYRLSSRRWRCTPLYPHYSTVHPCVAVTRLAYFHSDSCIRQFFEEQEIYRDAVKYSTQSLEWNGRIVKKLLRLIVYSNCGWRPLQIIERQM